MRGIHRPWTLAVLACVIAFTGCQEGYRLPSRTQATGLDKSGTNTTVASGVGNGFGFEGRTLVGSYAFRDAQHPCAEKGFSGQPLPNRQIFIMTEAGVQSASLVRDACADLADPLRMSVASLVFAGGPTGAVTYQGQQFQSVKGAFEFDVVAANCPGGRTAKAGASRTNLAVDSQNLLSSSWLSLPGVFTSLGGSAGGLPLYNLLRNDASYLETWRRDQQAITLTGGGTYAVSFFGMPGTVGSAEMIASSPNSSLTLEVAFDLGTGVSDTRYNIGAQGVSTASRSFAGGVVITVYFTAPAGAGRTDIGVAPYRMGPNGDGSGMVGDTVNVSAFQVEDVSTFCN